jgi:hypothetical protein
MVHKEGRACKENKKGKVYHGESVQSTTIYVIKDLRIVSKV